MMWQKSKNLRNIWTVAIIIVGNVLYALTVKLFLLPGNLMTGGTTGIGLMVGRLTGMSLSGFVFIFGNVGGWFYAAWEEICSYNSD